MQLPISDRRNRSLLIVSRLKPELTLQQANEQLKIIATAHEQAYPAENKNQDFLARPLSRLSISTSPQDDSELWAPFVLLQGLAAAVLLTSCLNLANMMLAFGATRQKEIAIRLAVGGARYRIVRQLLVQGMLLALAGGVVGMVTASWAVAGAGRGHGHGAAVRDQLRRVDGLSRGAGHVHVLRAGHDRLWPVARAADDAAGPADLAQGSGRRSVGTPRGPHHRARRPGHVAARVVAGAAGAQRLVRARRGRRRVRRSRVRARAAGDRRDRSAPRRLRHGEEPGGAAHRARAPARAARHRVRVGGLDPAVRRVHHHQPGAARGPAVAQRGSGGDAASW